MKDWEGLWMNFYFIFTEVDSFGIGDGAASISNEFELWRLERENYVFICK